jgi:hypothetical protein
MDTEHQRNRLEAQFLANTIDERFDSSADPDLVKWFIEQAGSNDFASSPALSA